jgi:hypothetical protein
VSFGILSWGLSPSPVTTGTAVSLGAGVLNSSAWESGKDGLKESNTKAKMQVIAFLGIYDFAGLLKGK